ncbi:MAG: cation:proton antiporter, partial [Bacteroidota bacterium]
MEFFVQHKELLVLIGGFLVIAIAANQIAKVFQQIKLPLITGLIISGILAGPYVLGLIPVISRDKLSFINEMSLAFIAFAAGAELYLRELRSRIKSIQWNTFGQLVVTFVLGSLGVFFMSPYIEYMSDLSVAAQASVAILTGTIFVARSPASAIAVVNELRAKGPFTQTVMGVTVLKDFLVIILFAINLSIAQTLIDGDEFKFLSILAIILELLLSASLGYFLGRMIALVLSQKFGTIYKLLLVLLLGYSAYLFSGEFRAITLDNWGHEVILEPLLICIIASVFVTNYTKYRPEFLKILHDAGPTIYVAFFTLTGASMSIDVLAGVWFVALILFGVRLITMIIGGYVGGTLAGDPIDYRHYGWMPYITQAGVALGLSTVVANEFP